MRPNSFALALAGALLSSAAAGAAAPERRVYAHFMGCCPAAARALPYHLRCRRDADIRKLLDPSTYTNAYTDAVGGGIVNWPLLPQGYEVDDYENARLEISRALRAGIDGFAFDAWAGGENAMRFLDIFFEVAEKMNVDFGLTVCFDPSCHRRDKPMLEKYIETARFVLRHRNSPNLARFDGKPLFFGYYSGGIVDRIPDEPVEARCERVAEGWRKWRAALGEPVFLHGSIDGFLDPKNPAADYAALGRWAGKTFDAVGAFTGTDHGIWWGRDDRLWRAVKEVGAVWSEPLIPQYDNKLGGILTGRGLELMETSWCNAIARDARLLQFVTWNDYGEETVLAPAYGGNYTVMRLNRWFAERWKTGRKPVEERDEVHVVFRRYLRTDEPFPFFSRLADRPTALEVLSFLKAPGTVEVENYGSYDAPAGLFVKRFELQTGPIVTRVRRGGRVALDWTCPERVAEMSWREDYELAAYGSSDEEEWKREFPGHPYFAHVENADDDGDGLPNWFEMLYFGKFPFRDTATCARPGDDPDGDGLTNLQEFRRRTNPLVKDEPYRRGHVWATSDLAANPLFFNPMRDARGSYVWELRYKFGAVGAIAHDGDYPLVGWAGGAGKRRSSGVYVPNPLVPNGWGGSATVSRDGVIRLGARHGCAMVLAWRSPVEGTVDVDVEVSAGGGGGTSRVTVEKGVQLLAETSLVSNERRALAARALRVKKGDRILVMVDHDKTYGLGPVSVEKFRVVLR